MPAFALSDADLAAIVAFIHDQKTPGGHRERRPPQRRRADLQTGDAAAGKRYFDARVRALSFGRPAISRALRRATRG